MRIPMILAMLLLSVLAAGVRFVRADEAVNAQSLLKQYQSTVEAASRVSFSCEMVIEHQPSGQSQTQRALFRRDGARYDVKYAIRHEGEFVWMLRSVVTDFELSNQFNRDGAPIMLFRGINLARARDGARSMLGKWSVHVDGRLPGDSALWEVMLAASDLKLNPGMEQVAGAHTYRLDATTSYGLLSAWLDPSTGCTLRRLVVRPKDLPNAKDVSYTTQIDRVANIGGVFFPAEVTELRTGVYDGNKLGYTNRATCTEVAINPDFGALGAFKLSFPNGALVGDKDINQVRWRWQDGGFVLAVESDAMKRVDQAVSEVASRNADSATSQRSASPDGNRTAPHGEALRARPIMGIACTVLGLLALVVIFVVFVKRSRKSI